MKKYIVSSISVVLMTVFMDCNSRTYDDISSNVPITKTITYAADVKPIMDANCLSCHGSGTYNDLSSYSTTKSEISNILDRIQRASGDPQKMPQGGTLSGAQIEIMLKWKQDGLQP